MDKLLELAEACERHARCHFAIAAGNITATAVDLSNIDRGLECLIRADALRARATQGSAPDAK